MTDNFQEGAEAMREACARECENKLKQIMPEWLRVPGTLKAARALWVTAKAIRAIDVESLR